MMAYIYKPKTETSLGYIYTYSEFEANLSYITKPSQKGYQASAAVVPPNSVVCKSLGQASITSRTLEVESGRLLP